MWAGVRPVSMEGQAARGRDPRAAVGPSRSSGTLLWEHVALGSDVPDRDPGQSGIFLLSHFNAGMWRW